MALITMAETRAEKVQMTCAEERGEEREPTVSTLGIDESSKGIEKTRCVSRDVTRNVNHSDLACDHHRVSFQVLVIAKHSGDYTGSCRPVRLVDEETLVNENIVPTLCAFSLLKDISWRTPDTSMSLKVKRPDCRRRGDQFDHPA